MSAQTKAQRYHEAHVAFCAALLAFAVFGLWGHYRLRREYAVESYVRPN